MLKKRVPENIKLQAILMQPKRNASEDDQRPPKSSRPSQEKAINLDRTRGDL